MLEVPKNLQERLEQAARTQGVSAERLLEEAIEIFLRLPPARRNANGFRVPSFVGQFASDEPGWIERHEELLWSETHADSR